MGTAAAAAGMAAGAGPGVDVSSNLPALVAVATLEVAAGSRDHDLYRGDYVARTIEAALHVAHTAAGADAVNQLWNSITSDRDWLTQKFAHRGIEGRELIDERLWIEDVRANKNYKANFPVWAREAFDAFATSNRTRNGDWRPWVDWYRAILPNSTKAGPKSAFGEKIDIEIARQPGSFWERGPDQVMADICRLVKDERLRRQGGDDDASSDAGQTIETTARGTTQPGEKRLGFLADVHDPTVDYLNRARMAFVLAARLNQIWDATNSESRRVPTTGSRPMKLRMRNGVEPIPPGFVVHIDAPWGGGKTSFASLLTQILNPYRHAKLPEWLKGLPIDNARSWPKVYRRAWHIVNFNAWRHQHVKPPWWIFYGAIRRQCRTAMVRETNRRATTLPRPYGTFDYRCWMGRRFFWLSEWVAEQAWRLWTPDFRTKLILTAAILSVLAILHWLGVIRFGSSGIELGTSAGQSNGDSLWLTLGVVVFGGASLVWTILSAITQTLFPWTPESAKNYSLGSGDPLDRFRKHFARMVEKFHRPIIIVVDDLDRCEPDYVVELIRGMQTILVSPRVVFVLLGDRDWIEQAFSETHKTMKGIDVGPEHEFGGRFVEKAIQFSLVLPDLPEKTRHRYVRDLLDLDDGNDAVEANGKIASRSAKDLVENLRTQTEAVLAVEGYIEREAKAAEVRESADLQGLDEDEKYALLHNFDVRLSLRAAADISAHRATSHMIEALSPMLPPNPRQIKRIVNAISLMQEVARLEGVANPDTKEWQIMARWIVLMIEWPRSWYTLSRYPGLADKALGLQDVGSDLPDDDGTLLSLLRSNEVAMKLLAFSNEQLGWPRADITSKEIFWLRTLMPATSGRLLDSRAARADRKSLT